MEDVLDLYCLPYDERYPVVCLDEKPYQLLDNILAPIPMKSGKPVKIDYEYERCGTCFIFVRGEPLTGWTYANARERRTAIDFAHEIKKLLTVYYPNSIKVRLVLDNLNTHVAASLYKAFPAKEARWDTCAVWKCTTPLNMAVGLIWRKSALAYWLVNASTGALKV
jgi:hypothetical protein